MSHKAKNILITFLLIVIACIFGMLYLQSYGRYCVPIIKEVKYPEAKDSLGKTQPDTAMFKLK